MPTTTRSQSQNGGATFPLSLVERIVDKVQSNKLTIVVGPTGCGKSTLLPQVLFEHYGSPILCTQPRRLAVMAVATHVARQRGVPLGQEVGYHVGQDRVANVNWSTGLLFATAGILLEELKCHGLDALTKFKAVIIDECHERSSESDLCLTIIKEFMIAYPRSKIRLVLMSATFNHEKYASFFRKVPGCEYVDTITLQTAESINSLYSNVQTLYLEDIARMLRQRGSSYPGIEGIFAGYINSMKYDPDQELRGADGGRSLSEELLKVILVLAMFLHQNDADSSPDSIFLIFAPTYRHLEQIHSMLSIASDHFDVGVLHSSIDIEDCLLSMQSQGADAGNDQKRKILLASAIADSSVTIPGVTCVIDTCRALEVKWDPERSRNNAQTVWASQAICDQRRGRTGRTCSGKVFRLVLQSFFNNKMKLWEEPKLKIASCRDEVLSLLSSSNKVMSNPKVLLEKTPDPPPALSISKALMYLKAIGACEEIESSRGRMKFVPTEYGRLVSTLPFTVEEASTIIHGAKNGLLHEALVLVTIKSARPQPIFQEFGENNLNEFNFCRYYSQVDMKTPMSIAIAHFAAYMFWYVNWNKIRRVAMMKQFVGYTTSIIDNEGGSAMFASDHDSNAHDCNVSKWSAEMDKAHIEWCKEHAINPSSVKLISQCVESTINTLYRSDFEPEWLRCQPLDPIWHRGGTMDFKERFGKYDVFSSIYGPSKGKVMASTSLLKLQEKSLSQRRDVVKSSRGRMACIHFLSGSCNFGDRCKNVHSYAAPRPLCRFQSNCTNPRCFYAHETPIPDDEVREDPMIDASFGKFTGGPFSWFCQNSSSMLLFLGEDISFRLSLGMLRAIPLMTASTSSFAGQFPDTVRFDPTRCYENLIGHRMNADVAKCAWIFPSTDPNATDGAQESLLQGFFMCIASFFRTKEGNKQVLQIGLVLHGNEFSRWNVLSSAHKAGLTLEWWDYFDQSVFPQYKPRDSHGDTIRVKNGRFYVFHLVASKDDSIRSSSQMIEIPQDANFGIELEMSSPNYLTPEVVATNLGINGGITVGVINNWSEGKKTSHNWKIVSDGSIVCNMSQPDCNRFELVSPVLRGEEGLRNVVHVLKTLPQINIKVNKSMGFHVHVDVSRYTDSHIIKICHQFIKYEDAIDLMMPKSRRTGSIESNSYFKSNAWAAKGYGMVINIDELVQVMNPGNDRYYKLNLQNLRTGRQPTIEFRQHSSTSNHEKVCAWVRFCVRFCENSANSYNEALEFDDDEDTVDVDSKFEALFLDVIKDSALYEFYRTRKKQLDVDAEACCNECALGLGCTKA